jgi:hypothetical protein
MMPDRNAVETSIASQWHGKHVPVAMNMHITTEKLLEAVFSVGLSRSYIGQ